jgi:hypothetical protein
MYLLQIGPIRTCNFSLVGGTRFRTRTRTRTLLYRSRLIKADRCESKNPQDSVRLVLSSVSPKGC